MNRMTKHGKSESCPLLSIPQYMSRHDDIKICSAYCETVLKALASMPAPPRRACEHWDATPTPANNCAGNAVQCSVEGNWIAYFLKALPPLPRSPFFFSIQWFRSISRNGSTTHLCLYWVSHMIIVLCFKLNENYPWIIFTACLKNNLKSVLGTRVGPFWKSPVMFPHSSLEFMLECCN